MKMRVKLKSTTFLSDSYGNSDRATAVKEISILQDISFNIDLDSCHWLDKNKKRVPKESLSDTTDFHFTLVCQLVET